MSRHGAIDWPALVDAVARDDIDAALALGLLGWPGDAACPRNAGVAEADIAQLQRVHGERSVALAARDRYRDRAARLERWQAERRQRQAGTLGAATADKAPALTGAAAAALARALAKAGR